MQVRYPNTHCCVCNKGFYRRPWEFKKWKEFCCRPCRSVLYKGNNYNWQKTLRLGSGWNKGKSKANGDILLYGRPRSNTTKQLISKKLKQVWVNNKGLFAHFKDTDIELILEAWLIQNKIPHQKQKPLLNITIVDFFIPPNICLYADGDYWHSRPRTLQRDRFISRRLRENNYCVIRLLGSEIKKGIRPLAILQKG